LIREDILSLAGRKEARIADDSPAIAILKIADKSILAVNDRFCRVLGYTREEIRIRAPVCLDLCRILEGFAAAAAMAGTKDFASKEARRYARRDGSFLEGITRVEGVELAGEACILLVIEDASDQGRIDRELAESDAHYHALFEATASAVVEEDFSQAKVFIDALLAGGVSDLDAYFVEHPEDLKRCAGMLRILRFNREYVEYVNLPDRESVGKSVQPFIPEGSMGILRREFVALSSGQRSLDISFPNLIAGSKVKHTRMLLTVVAGHESDWASVLISFIDISKEYQTQGELAGLLEQKDMLMRELEHRVKNNLNIISSLLSLESAQVSGASERKILLDAQSRIKSISLIYDLLSRSSQGNAMNCRSYIESLAMLLRETYTAGRKDIELDLAIDDIDIDIKRGVSLGLVTTELLTNAFKYAFQERGGKVRIRLASHGDSIELSIADDGPGAPKGFDAHSSGSLGFQLIEMLVQQMRGSLEISPSPGFKTEICIPLTP
jgi:PAS domain S-box-containing protein